MAAAIRLAKKGLKVEVFESNKHVGGKMSKIKGNGYTFDGGPSLFTEPHLIDELISLSDKKPRDYFNFLKLKESCRYFYKDGTKIIGHSNHDLFSDEVFNKTGVKREKVIGHLKKSKFIYDTTKSLFLEKSLHKISTYLSLNTLLSFLKLPFLNIFKTMDEVNSKRFGNTKIAQLFNRYATYNGSDPFKAPAILNVIPHLEFNKGAYFPFGGMRSIPKLLHELCLSLGVKFHLNSSVEEIILKKKSAIGVRCCNDIFHADIILANTDVFFVYNKLLNKHPNYKTILSQERSTSALIFYWGIKKQFPDLDLHNILFSENYKDEFNDLTNKNIVPKDPTVYINITSKYNKTDAPTSSENWFVMINVPSSHNLDWQEVIVDSRNKIINKINNYLKTDIQEFIEFEDILDPIKIENQTGSYKGSLYGTASNKKTSAFFRHPNFSNKIKNLYFCGGSVHPGGGIPLALNSAKIVSDLIKK